MLEISEQIKFGSRNSSFSKLEKERGDKKRRVLKGMLVLGTVFSTRNQESFHGG